MSEKPVIKKPSIHLNGTSVEHLVESYGEAVRTLTAALRAVLETAPNACDYYPQGSAAFDEAFKEHSARFDRVEAVLQEMQQLATHCLDEAEGQLEQRARRRA